MIYAGIDVGSVAAKAVILSNGKILSRVIQPTGWSPGEAGKAVFEAALAEAKITRQDVTRIVGTGYGRVALDFIDRAVTEITCHALGANYFFPANNLVIDIGGQDSKAILINKDGKVLNFIMNDKCAAGTGRFIQVIAMTLGLELDRLKELPPAKPAAINSMCTVFAESEVVSLLTQNVPKERIVSGLYRSIARRTAAMAASLGSVRGVTFTGGVARIPGMQEALSDALGCPVNVPDNPQIIGALGAAILAEND
ncbi:acyl-CoA dehydratase activase [Thermincola potens]|uniref:CoA-substrate-specific enzyme activase n=1 Tax=Thermincola potens (strain JR) TaxID=635013 RepID=D5XD77_THEPJ|nr:acyl-CoA dehydratase activase [Thermincola potens]ADG81725.1 CoA-substrate-specific enzyme activase [Thermincola potens JR]